MSVVRILTAKERAHGGVFVSASARIRLGWLEYLSGILEQSPYFRSAIIFSMGRREVIVWM